MKKNKKFWLGLLPGLLTLLLDRLTKKALFGRNRMLLPGVIRITSARNTGMALGLMPNSAWAVLLLSALLLGLCIWLLRGMRLSGMAAAGVSLMAGGALGNLIDRAALGYVRDLFELLFVKFYIFNIADVGVVAGAVLCGVSLLWRPQDWSRRC
ncbi:MAG: signal peptidase II [Eubacteriales bacterium]|nr:signal peptidase II [Eubacteriales bacterium]